MLLVCVFVLFTDVNMQYRWITVCNTVLLVLSTTLLTTALFRNSWWKNEHVHVGLHGVCVNKDYTTSAERCVNFNALGTFADTLPGYIQFSDTGKKHFVMSLYFMPFYQMNYFQRFFKCIFFCSLPHL